MKVVLSLKVTTVSFFVTSLLFIFSFLGFPPPEAIRKPIVLESRVIDANEPSSLDQFFNSAPQELQQLQLRDHAVQVTDDKGFRYRVDCRGFSPEELKVAVEGDALVIRGEHKSEKENELIQRSFLRRVTLPKDVKKEAIKCDLDDGGQLVVFAPKAVTAGSDIIPIPIEFKKAERKVI